MCSSESGMSCTQRKALNLCGEPSALPARMIALEQLCLEMDAPEAPSETETRESDDRKEPGHEARRSAVAAPGNGNAPRFI